MLRGSLALLQDVQLAVVNQGRSFIKFNPIFMLFASVWKPKLFELSACVCLVLHHALICANVFHNLSCSVSHVLHVIICLFKILGYNLDYCPHTLMTCKEILFFLFL